MMAPSPSRPHKTLSKTFILCFAVPRITPRASDILSEHSTAELYPKPSVNVSVTFKLSLFAENFLKNVVFTEQAQELETLEFGFASRLGIPSLMHSLNHLPGGHSFSRCSLLLQHPHCGYPWGRLSPLTGGSACQDAMAPSVCG